MNYMSTYKDLSDAELAETLSNWMGDALNSWDHFSDEEKSFFRQLQDEACKRFIMQNTKEAADEN